MAIKCLEAEFADATLSISLPPTSPYTSQNSSSQMDKEKLEQGHQGKPKVKCKTNTIGREKYKDAEQFLQR